MRFGSIVFIFLAVTILFVFTCAGCGDPHKEGSANVRIVALAPLSGPFASTGGDMRAGFDLALEVINQTYDLQLPLAATKELSRHPGAIIELLYSDTENDPDHAASLVSGLGTSGYITAFIGCYSSSVTAKASTAAEIEGVPFMNTHSTAPSLTRRGYQWFFRTTPDDSVFAANLLQFWLGLQQEQARDGRASLALVYEQGVWGTGVAREGVQQSLRHGLEVVADVSYRPGDPVDDAVREVARADPAVILQASYLDDAVDFMRAYKKYDVSPTAILAIDAGFSHPQFADRLGSTAEYVFSREVYSPDLAGVKPLVGEVAELFYRKKGREMSGTALRAFVGMLTLADALNRAQDFSPEEVRRALLETDLPGAVLPVPWEGVRFDPDSGQNELGRGIVVQMQDGLARKTGRGEAGLAGSRVEQTVIKAEQSCARCRIVCSGPVWDVRW